MSPERQRRYDANRKRKPRKSGENVIWRRIKDNIDDLVLRTGANPEIASVLSRLVLFGHLSKEEGEIARLYTRIMQRHARYCDTPAHTARAQVYDRGSPGSIDEIERNEVQGTLREYEKRAKYARRQHDRIEKVLLPYMHGRDILDDICMNDKEINAKQYPSIKAMLHLIAAEFGIAMQGGKLAKKGEKKQRFTDARLIADAACETLESAAKRNRIIITGFSLKTSASDRRVKSFALHGTRVTEKLVAKVTAHKPLLPEGIEAALLKAAEARGWKEIV